MDVYHLGRCGKCGKALTEPESISTGLGPICGGRIKLTNLQERNLKFKSIFSE
jgi:rRNA maturation endonuclease Nob1